MLTAAGAAKELLIRRAARSGVLAFAEAIDVPGRPVEGDEDDVAPVVAETKLAAHHKLILEECEACSQRVGGRLILLFPPGSAKTTYGSIVFPAYKMGSKPGTQIILASYGDTLAVKMGRRTRGIVSQSRYGSLFGTALSNDGKAVNNFVLSNGSEYMACGILGGVTGNRANGIICDDLIKGREQANSETIRDKTWEAYQDDLLTRLKPGGWVIHILTRWHEDDSVGRILPPDWNGESGDIVGTDGNTWRVVCVPAECERPECDPLGRAKGEYLWPEWFTKQHWDQYRSNPRTWGSLFQQRPTPLDGDLFYPGRIQILDAMPAGQITWVRGWDLASVHGGGDWTAGLKLGRHSDGRFIIADIVRGQLGPDRRDELIRNTAQHDGRQVKQDIATDPGQSGLSQIVALGKLLVGYTMVTSRESGDKVTRAEAFATQVNVGNVYMLRGSWNAAYTAELRSFPNGTWDDQVYASSRAFNRLLLIAGKMRITKKLLSKI